MSDRRIREREVHTGSLPPSATDMFDAGGANARRRARNQRWFTVAVGLPIILALGLLAVLLYDVVTDSFSWQLVEPRNSGVSFSFGEGFGLFSTWERVVTLDLLAQGQSQQEIDALLADPESRRIYDARNRVELMLWADGAPL